MPPIKYFFAVLLANEHRWYLDSTPSAIIVHHDFFYVDLGLIMHHNSYSCTHFFHLTDFVYKCAGFLTGNCSIGKEERCHWAVFTLDFSLVARPVFILFTCFWILLVKVELAHYCTSVGDRAKICVACLYFPIYYAFCFSKH